MGGQALRNQPRGGRHLFLNPSALPPNVCRTIIEEHEVCGCENLAGDEARERSAIAASSGDSHQTYTPVQYSPCIVCSRADVAEA